MIYEIKDTQTVSSLFGQWEETFIWSCLQGIMGKIYGSVPVKSQDAHIRGFDLRGRRRETLPAYPPDPLPAGIKPTSAKAVIGDFTFFAGEPDPELISYKPAGCTQNFMIMVPQNSLWERAITQVYGSKSKVVSRYALKKEPHVFNKKSLENAVASLSKQYHLSMIDEHIYSLCKRERWSADLVSQFSTYPQYEKLGLGVVVLEDSRIVSGASSYSRYREGIEIEIDTREDHRRKGLAYICGAKLILECLKRNLYPSWDAQNKSSLALAQKLGYHYSHTYTAIEIWDY